MRELANPSHERRELANPSHAMQAFPLMERTALNRNVTCLLEIKYSRKFDS